MSGIPRPGFSRETAVSLVAGVASVATSFALAGLTPSFVGAPVEGFLSRAMPGQVVALAITTLGNLGQQLNLALALVLVTAAFAGLVRLGLVGRGWSRGGSIALAALLPSLLVVSLNGRFLQAALVAGVVTAVVAVAEFARGDPRRDLFSTRRRRALSTIGGALGLATVGYGAGRFGQPSATATAAPPLRGPTVDRTAIEESLAAATAAELDEDPLAPAVSEEFYTVDINAVDPEVAADEWELSITGAVEQERTFTYADIRGMSSENRFVTLRCVGEALNGHKMDTALWTGVPVADLLERASPSGNCDCVMLRGADDYYMEFPLAALEPGLLAYGMNGTLLPRSHGYPLRALVPGHWGEVNLKWLTEIELLEREAEGYWEKRGWHGDGPVVPVAKLHTEVDRPEGRLLGGHAYAGTRGVTTVEVSTDGTETWNEAQLSDRLPGNDVWRQWAYTYDPPAERHVVVVRLIDDEGSVQPGVRRGAFPNGPAGWVKRTYEAGEAAGEDRAY